MLFSLQNARKQPSKFWKFHRKPEILIISFIKVKIQKLQKPFQKLPDNILEPFEASKHSKSSFEDKRRDYVGKIEGTEDVIKIYWNPEDKLTYEYKNSF